MRKPWTDWVLDATIATPPGTFCFCPIEGDIGGEFEIVTGMNMITDEPPGKLVAIVHEDGQAAVEAWMAEHKADLDALKQRIAEADRLGREGRGSTKEGR